MDVEIVVTSGFPELGAGFLPLISIIFFELLDVLGIVDLSSILFISGVWKLEKGLV